MDLEPPRELTLGGRLAWVREQKLGFRSGTSFAKWIQELPPAEQPESTSQSSVWKYEADRRSPPLSYVLLLARKGQVNFRWLAAGAGRPDDPESPGEAEWKLEAIRRIVDATSSEDVSEALERVVRHLGGEEEGSGKLAG